jgi:phenylalanyl-tRNA synthetase alpha chain
MTTEESETAILTYLSASPETVIDDTYPWSQSNKLDHKTVVGAIKSLLADKYVVVENLETSFYALTDEGQSILDNGSQEILVLKALNEAGKMSIPDLQSQVGKDVAKIGMGNCMKANWVKKDGTDLVPLKMNDQVEDTVRKQLQHLKDAEFRIDAFSEMVSFLEPMVLDFIRSLVLSCGERDSHAYQLFLKNKNWK